MCWRFRILSVAVFLIAQSVAAQNLVVTRSPHSPGEQRYWADIAPAQIPLAAFRFAAIGAPAEIGGMTVTVRGTGDFSNDLIPGDGLQAWLDDGDGKWDSTKDLMVAIAAGDSPTVRLWIGPVDIADGSHVDVWIVAHFWGVRMALSSYGVAIADASDVDAPSANVTLGSPEPKSSLVWILPPPSNSGDRVNTIPCQVATTTGYSVLIWSLVLMIAIGLLRYRTHRQANL